MKLVWSKQSDRDRDRIRDYISQDNPNAAIALDTLFSEKARNLEKFPQLGRSGILGTRELVVHRHYILVYRIINNNVRILRVMHTRKQRP